MCAPKGTLPITATDALACLRKAVGQAVTLRCPCGGSTTTTLSATTSTTISELCSGGPVSDPTLAETVLTFLDDARASVTPPADPPLSTVCYDAALEAKAKSSAAACVCEFDAPVNDALESLACGPSLTATGALNALFTSQKFFYDYDTATCSAFCDDYCQMISRTTSAVGCALTACESNGEFTAPWNKFVCWWAPPAPCVSDVAPY